MQDKSAAGSGFTLRVAASFNTAVKAAPSGRWGLGVKNPRSAPFLKSLCPMVVCTCPVCGAQGISGHERAFIRLYGYVVTCHGCGAKLTVGGRPDFQIQFGATEVGIEVTEAVSEQYAAYSALAEREFPGVFLEPGHFRWGSPNLSVDKMRSLLRQSQLSASPWVGDYAEREWASYMQSAIESKLIKLAKPGFHHFSENWLSIYDNLPLCHIHLEKAIAFLLPTLAAYWSKRPSFSAIYIEHGPVIAMLSPTNVRYLSLCDLW